MIKGLHHNAYRCRDSEQTRRFYEDLLGLPLGLAFEIDVTKTGRRVSKPAASWITVLSNPSTCAIPMAMSSS
ncbi:MAG: hypothetical protein RLZZ385_813 [Pseudomonadota bacterium]|jgi:catechol 2,3-dioxygenase-like lactoylglutathione lyase family enzyme